MPQDVSDQKTNFASQIIALAADILLLAERCDEASATYFANGFNSGGASPIVEADIVGSNKHLTVAAITNVVTAAQGITTATPSGTRDNLRRALGKPQF